MHFHAEHGLFFETRRPLWTVVLSLASVVIVLGLNVFLGSVAFFSRCGCRGHSLTPIRIHPWAFQDRASRCLAYCHRYVWPNWIRRIEARPRCLHEYIREDYLRNDLDTMAGYAS